MSLTLTIDFSDILLVQELIKLQDIPCFCRVSGNVSFELEFQNPLPQAIGKVEGWTASLIDERSWAGAGGLYTHYCFSMVSIEPIRQGFYRIMSLKFFNRSCGWCRLIEDGNWAVPALNSQEELAEWDALFPSRDKKKKHRL